MPAPLATKVAGRDLHGISYNDVKPGKPPIPITTAPRPSSAQANLHPSLRPTTSPQPSLDGSSAQSIDRDQVKRDSGYTVTTSIGRDSRTTLATDTESVRKSHSIRKSQSLPGFNGSAKQSPSSIRISKRRNDPKTKPQESNDKAPKLPDPTFMNKPTELPTLPTISFEDLTKLEQLEFSKRGSLLISGRRASEMSTPSPGRALSNGSTNKAVASAISTVLRIPQRALSDDEEALSLKVRSMYDTGMDPDSASAVLRPSMDGRPGIEEEVIEEEPASPGGTLLTADDALQRRISSNTTAGRASFIREDRELAGGIEDWQDVDAAEVDRYGFIVPQPAVSASTNSLPAPELRLHRVSTALQAASETPRRSHSRIGRAPSMTHPARSASGNSHHTKALVRPVSSQSSYVNKRSVSRVRSAANRLPHNRNRRAMDEAGDMLTLRPGLADLAEQVEGSRNAGAARKKESAREEKWRKMAKATKPHGPGGNTRYEFDTKDPKVILRTWKGIPDRWRATAWHSFLTASAKRRKGFVPDEDLMAAFDELVGQSSPDDVQIDIDVPRTINSHIMFRRRYRGGQRLLFRVLHALSLYFPDTGYVQGMAALAATFLCYFDEQMAFVMLVRLWQVRGLDRLYKSGFAGLIQALDEFERAWLAGGVVSAKLNELGIAATAYGTRWYLTIFNYSIPFPAQLRVWDVFLLLGDPDPLPYSPSPSSRRTQRPKSSSSPSSPQTTNPTSPALPTLAAPGSTPPPTANRRNSQPGKEEEQEEKAEEDLSFHGALDVLHATAAALIDGMREILLDADFETAMKCLTSWVPIRDEDVLMRVAAAEWKVYRERRRRGRRGNEGRV